ncbi:hypothetical protein [Thermoplasma volcanium]|uniref:hypothetical protein n=1 Tax=Thermoplasma volcanium TaxID=50339 RepID=UPI0012EA94DD|nr:hypothetical protein [Thermoplasma volcanium]
MFPYQKIIDAMKKAEKCKDRKMDELQEENKKLKEQLDEYKKRHPPEHRREEREVL